MKYNAYNGKQKKSNAWICPHVVQCLENIKKNIMQSQKYVWCIKLQSINIYRSYVAILRFFILSLVGFWAGGNAGLLSSSILFLGLALLSSSCFPVFFSTFLRSGLFSFSVLKSSCFFSRNFFGVRCTFLDVFLRPVWTVVISFSWPSITWKFWKVWIRSIFLLVFPGDFLLVIFFSSVVLLSWSWAWHSSPGVG